MTKMTLLHFASPFAFSMPVPPRSTILRTGTASDTTKGPESSATGATLWPASGSDTDEDRPAWAPERAGLEASLYDTVLLRYREQIGAGPETSPVTEVESSLT